MNDPPPLETKNDADARGEHAYGGDSEHLIWARRRTLLSKERTYSAWVRTGLSAEAAGLAVARWLNSPQTNWIAPTLGTALVLIGALIFVLAFISYRNVMQELAKRGAVGMPLWALRLLSAALCITALLALLLIALW